MQWDGVSCIVSVMLSVATWHHNYGLIIRLGFNNKLFISIKNSTFLKSWPMACHRWCRSFTSTLTFDAIEPTTLKIWFSAWQPLLINYIILLVYNTIFLDQSRAVHISVNSRWWLVNKWWFSWTLSSLSCKDEFPVCKICVLIIYVLSQF